jgi:DNA polymerase III delta subunit
MVELNNFYYLFGTNTHLLNKYKKLFLLKKERDNYTIEYLKESLPNPIFNFFTDKTLYLLDPSDFNDDQLLSWLDTLDQTYVLFTSNKRCDFLIKKLKPSNVKEFKTPDFFHQKSEATSFLISELKSYGKTIAPNLASIIVQKCGVDYGILSFEAFKINHISSNIDIQIQDIQGVLADTADSPLASFMESLSIKSDREILRQLFLLKKSLPEGGIISVCTYIAPTVLKWLAASTLSEEGRTITESATLLGLNPWYYENTILPSARQWGVKKLQTLVKHLAECHRLGLSGAFNPWGHFESGLLELLG